MTLPNLELLSGASVTFVSGRKYGLIGRNGIGKTTFLKHLAAHMFPAIPTHLQILHIEQEVASSELNVLQAVVSTDVERQTLMEELQAIERADKGEKLSGEMEDEFGVFAMTVSERTDRMLEIYQRLKDIDADQAEPRAAAILAGLGFSPSAQLQPTKVGRLNSASSIILKHLVI